MSDLASIYAYLDRDGDALAMRERVLEFNLRVLPENHPSIGEVGMWYDVSIVMRCCNCRRGHGRSFYVLRSL